MDISCNILLSANTGTIQLIITRSYIFVEFFFLVSGFLFGKKLLSASQDYNECSLFRQRVKSLYPDYLLSTIICGVVMRLTRTKGIYQVFFAWCCELTFANSIGINFHWTNGPAWFISALLCATLILMLLIKCLKKIWNIELISILLIALGICCYSYIDHATQSGIGFTLTDKIERQVLPIGTIRAIGGFSIGIGLSQIKLQKLESVKRPVLSILGIVLMSSVLFTKSLFEDLRFQCQMVMVLGYVFLIAGACGEEGYREPNFFEKAISQYSMYIFLNHYAVAILLPYLLGNAEENYLKMIPLFIIVTIALSVLEKKLSTYIRGKIFPLVSHNQPGEKF